MSSVIIPVEPSAPLQQLQVELDGVTYTLQFHWNARCFSWFMHLMDSQQNHILMGRRVCIGWPLLGRFVNRPGVPPGLLEAIDTSQQDLEAGLDDLGDRVILMYTPVGG